MTSPFARPRAVDLAGWILLAVALLLATYIRWRLAEFPLERDEGEFAYAGQLILDGVPPYKLAYNMKLPGTYLAYAALMAVFGQTTAGIHLGLLAVNLVTIVLLYRFVRELFDPFSAGMAAVAYAILSVSQSVLGMAAHATHFVALFGLAGVYLLWRHLQSGRWPPALASGLLLGIAFLMKQQGVFLMVFGGGFLLLLGLLLKDYPRRRLALNTIVFSAGAVLPYLLTCLWLYQAGVWPKFSFWTIQYASKYVQAYPLSVAWSVFWMSFVGDAQVSIAVMPPNWPLWVLACVGVVGVAVAGRAKPGLRSFVFGFLVFSFLCVCPGFYFRNHYFIVMLPAVAMLAGVGCRLLWDLAGLWAMAVIPAAPAAAAPARQKKRHARPEHAEPQPAKAPAGGFNPLQAMVALLVLVAVGGTLWMQRDFLFNWPPQLACRMTYKSNPFAESPVIAEYLKAHTEPGDTIAVLGSEPQIYFQAQRRSATGYIYTYGLVEMQPLAQRMQKEMIEEIEAAKPKYIVFANVRCSWITQPNSETAIFDWAVEYLSANYHPVGALEPKSELETAVFWDEELRNYQPPKDVRMLDVYWKLTPYPDAPKMQKYCRLPYILVYRRNS